MNLVLFDDPSIRMNLLPFTYTRPVAAIRVGILTIEEKWKKLLDQPAFFRTENYLSEKFPATISTDNLLINGAVCPDRVLIKVVQSLKKGEALAKDHADEGHKAAC